MKHTPGPWTLEAGRNIVTQSGEFYITYGQDRYKNPKFKDFCELDANAHLIAAAPDMLNALRSIVFQVIQGKVLERDACITQAREAIVKAEGK